MSLNIAHRGFSGMYPENTLLAYEKAIEAGCDGIELDVQLTKDGELVLMHDEDVDRTTDGTGWIKDKTFAELRELEASFKFRGKYGVNRVPTLREYFELAAPAGILTNIELKTSIFRYAGIEEKTLSLIDEFGLRDKVVVSSFNHYSAKYFQSLAPEIPCGFLTESVIIGGLPYTVEHGIPCYHPEFHMCDDAFMEEANRLGLEINVWTVNEEEDMREMKRLGINMIIGNWPDRCKRVLEEG